MKIIYYFDTENENDVGDHLIFSKSVKFFLCLSEINNKIRSYQKYSQKQDLDPICSTLLEDIRLEISETGIDEIP